MCITEEQRHILNSLVVERLCLHKSENIQLVKTFSNQRNLTLEKIIKSQLAIDNDESGRIAYYLVMTPTRELIGYFSLKCGQLFQDLDIQKLMLAQQTAEAIEVLQDKERFTEEKIQEASIFITDNIEDIKAILPNIDEYIQKKKSYSKDLHKELNTKMKQVLHTHPAVELVEFCANENGRSAWKALGIDHKAGECIFWHHIVPKIQALREIVGCQYIYLFAADMSYDRTLINYYSQALRFTEPIDLGANKPHYDFLCTFMCQSLGDLEENQKAFYIYFNPDDEPQDIV